MAYPESTRKRQSREYYLRNREAVLARVKRYANSHKQERKEYVEANRDKVNQISAAWRIRNKGQWEECARKAKAKYASNLRAELLAAYGGKCACCGEDDPEFLAVDHIHRDGGAERKRLGWMASGTSFYLRLKKAGWPKDRYRLLCMNCNFATRLGKECPHQRKIALVKSSAMEG